MVAQWYSATVQSTMSETWGYFWAEFGVKFSNPVIALIGDKNSSGIKKIVFFNGQQIALITLEASQRSIFKYDSDKDLIQIDGKLVTHSIASTWIKKVIYMLQENRVAWFFVVNRKKGAIHRNPYWERVAESVAKTLHLPTSIDLIAAGKQGSSTVLGVQSGLLKLQSLFEMASTKEWEDLPFPPPSFAQLIRGSNALLDFNSDSVVATFFSEDIQSIVASDSLYLMGQRIHVDTLFDYVLEFENTSYLKRKLSVLELWLLGLPVIQANRETINQRIWKLNNGTFGEMKMEMIRLAHYIRSELSELIVVQFCEAIEAQPFALINGSNDTLRRHVVTQLIKLDRMVQQLQSFFEWNYHVLPYALRCLDRLRVVKDLLNRWIQRSAESVGELGLLVDEIKTRREQATKRIQQIQGMVDQLISIEGLNRINDQLNMIDL